jgi:hypothetical protein
MSLAQGAALTVAVVAALVLVRLQRRHVRAVRRDRAALFATAAGVLDDARIQPRGLDFPVLHGSFDGRPVRVEPVVDAVSLRMVPVLRLVVTVRDDLAGQPRLSVLRDETGQEFYAGHRGLPRARDAAWPSRLSVAFADGVRDAVVTAAVEAVANDEGVKQVLVTDRGVRCVVRAAQSDGATYRVTRRVDLTGVRVADAVLRDAVRTASALCDRTRLVVAPAAAVSP